MKNFVIAVSACCMGLPSAANAQTFVLSENSKGLAHSYLGCVLSEATKLNGAGESVSDTVEFAKTACANHKLQIAMAVLTDVNAELPKSSGESRINVAKQLRETIDEQVTQEARLRLARIRSEAPNAKN